jgi:hypothetical protein
MRFLCRLVAAVAVAVPALLSPNAYAVGTLAVGTPVWSRPDTSAQFNEINREVCMSDTAEVSFDVTFTEPGTGSFELWAGDGCEDDTKRTDDSTVCVHVMNGPTKTGTISVRAQDLVKKPGDGVAPATAAVCDEGNEEGQVSRTLYFLVVSGGAYQYQGVPAFAYKYDTRAPKPPTMITAGAGEASLIVELEEPDELNVERYRFYCAPTDSGTVAGCSASKLVPGEDPDGTTECGSQSAKGTQTFTTSATLDNGVAYAVAVASEDDVGNVGVLSEVACGTPKEVTGFYEAYRAAGGEAGGGFCSFAPARRGAVPLGLALLLGCAALARRRR